MRDSKYMIFFGAGASASEGAPIQSTLFEMYFKTLEDVENKWFDIELIHFLNEYFGIEFPIDNNKKLNFPTFEEILGILDQAIIKNQSLRYFCNDAGLQNGDKLRKLRRAVLMVLARVLHESLGTTNRYHKRLVRNLIGLDLIKDTTFVTTNYDILVDNSLAAELGHKIPNYCFEFGQIRGGYEQLPQNDETPKILKLHGSLNWLHCPTCNKITLTPYEKGVITLYIDPNNAACNKCQTLMMPLIIPPTYYKELNNYYINQCMFEFDKTLHETQHLIFCGYSFPDADMHIKYYLKRAEINRNDRLRVTVINNHEGKNEDTKAIEKERFDRFFKYGVDYTEYSFNEFAENPELIMQTQTTIL